MQHVRILVIIHITYNYFFFITTQIVVIDILYTNNLVGHLLLISDAPINVKKKGKLLFQGISGQKH